jgi:hypothetical protein
MFFSSPTAGSTSAASSATLFAWNSSFPRSAQVWPMSTAKATMTSNLSEMTADGIGSCRLHRDTDCQSLVKVSVAWPIIPLRPVHVAVAAPAQDQ